MSQIIACKTENGILLASDSRAVEMDLQGHLTEHEINRLFQLQLYLLWTKKKLPLIDGDEISTAYSVPRLMTLEFQLNQRCKKNEPFNRIIPLIRGCLDKQSSANNEIAGPFSFACITRDGFAALAK